MRKSSLRTRRRSAALSNLGTPDEFKLGELAPSVEVACFSVETMTCFSSVGTTCFSTASIAIVDWYVEGGYFELRGRKFDSTRPKSETSSQANLQAT